MTKLIDITHSLGDFSEWTTTVVDGGDLSVSVAAALAVTNYGMSVTINDLTNIYARKTVATDYSGVIRGRFYVDVNSLNMSNGDDFIMCMPRNSSVLSLLYVAIQRLALHRFTVTAIDDPLSGPSASYITTDAPHWLEFKLVRATTNVSSDGYLEFWIDGIPQLPIRNVDNYDRFMDFASIDFGAQGAIDVGTSGIFYIDEIVVNNDGSYIGPRISTSTSNGDIYLYAGEANPHDIVVRDPTKSGATSLVVQDASHGVVSDNVGLIQHNILSVGDSVHALSSDNVALVQHNILAIDNSVHALSSDNIVVTAHAPATPLIVQDTAHGHTAENVVLTQHNVLAVANSAHVHTVDNLVLTQHNVLVVSNAVHALVSDNLTLTQHYVLVVANSTHVHTVDNLSLTQHNVLAVLNTAHGLVSDNVTLTQHNILVVQDAIHLHTAGNTVLTQHNVLVVQNSAHVHTVDSVSVTYHPPGAVVLTVQDAVHGLVSDNTLLTQHNILEVQNAEHQLGSDNVDLTQHNILVVQNSAHVLTSDNISPAIIPSLIIVSGGGGVFGSREEEEKPEYIPREKPGYRQPIAPEVFPVKDYIEEEDEEIIAAFLAMLTQEEYTIIK